MRIAAISDIHGNLPALEAVLAEIDAADVDEIVVAGDTAHGPWPAEVVDLSQQLGVSGATVRRDLSLLAREGRLERVHGGAAPLGTVEPPFEVVADDHKDAKARVGATAAELVRDGDVVLVDIGTTTSHLARALRGREVTVITSSLAVYDELAHDAHGGVGAAARDEQPVGEV